MSQIIQALHSVRCDGCGQRTGGLFLILEKAEEQAKRLGWEVGPNLRHCCPDCLKKREAKP